MLEHLISTASCQDAALARMRAPWQRMILPLASCSYSPYLQCGMALCPTRKPAERTHTRLLPACLPLPPAQPLHPHTLTDSQTTGEPDGIQVESQYTAPSKMEDSDRHRNEQTFSHTGTYGGLNWSKVAFCFMIVCIGWINMWLKEYRCINRI